MLLIKDIKRLSLVHNLSNARSTKTMHSEKWAVYESQRVFRELVGKN